MPQRGPTIVLGLAVLDSSSSLTCISCINFSSGPLLYNTSSTTWRMTRFEWLQPPWSPLYRCGREAKRQGEGGGLHSTILDTVVHLFFPTHTCVSFLSISTPKRTCACGSQQPEARIWAGIVTAYSISRNRTSGISASWTICYTYSSSALMPHNLLDATRLEGHQCVLPFPSPRPLTLSSLLLTPRPVASIVQASWTCFDPSLINNLIDPRSRQ